MELLQAKQITKSNLDKSTKNGISNDERNRNFVETKQENPNTSDEDEISFFLFLFQYHNCSSWLNDKKGIILINKK